MDDKTLSDFMPKTNSEGEIIYGEFSKQSSVRLTIDEVKKRLSTIKDPELGINIYDLGLIYHINIDKGNINAFEWRNSRLISYFLSKKPKMVLENSRAGFYSILLFQNQFNYFKTCQ